MSAPLLTPLEIVALKSQDFVPHLKKKAKEGKVLTAVQLVVFKLSPSLCPNETHTEKLLNFGHPSLQRTFAQLNSFLLFCCQGSSAYKSAGAVQWDVRACKGSRKLLAKLRDFRKTKKKEKKKERNLGGVANSQSAPAKASDTTEQHVHSQLMEFISPHSVLRSDMVYKTFN